MFTVEQINAYKKKLHSKVHWMLIYKEADDYQYFNQYCENLIQYINSLNEIVGHDPNVIELMVLVQMAYDETLKENYSFKSFRKCVLEAHQVVDKLWG